MICEMINKGQGARVRGQGNETVSLRALVSLRAGFMSLREERSNPFGLSKIASSQLSLKYFEEVGIVMFSSELNIEEKHTSLRLLIEMLLARTLGSKIRKKIIIYFGKKLCF